MSTDVTTNNAPVATAPSLGTTGQQQTSRNIFGGDLGQLPVVAALVLMTIYFNIDSQGLFLSPRNLSNLTLQTTVVGITALASVLVLLLGEIDLSIAAVSNLCGAVMCVFSVYHGWGVIPSILAGMVVGAVIGFVNGIIVSVIRVPSFIVTLAGFLGYEGVLQHVLQPNDSIRISDQGLLGIASGYMPEYLSIALPLIAVGLYAAYIVWQRISRQRKQLYVSSWGITAVRIAVVAVPVVLALFVYENYYGVPYLAAIMIGLVVLFWIILRFTTFGRHVYAVGGNTEAARRAGIPVVRTRIIIFTLTSLLAGVAGDLEAMRQTTATALVSPNLLLEAIAAAVIGGVSLFGGRGSVWAAVLGTLVIGGLINGLVLQDRTSDVQLMVEGAVLVLAVVVDALIRRRNAVTGR